MGREGLEFVPEMAFEVSWEVCNKVGGIHTVIASKAPEILKSLGENYIVIGPDIWREEKNNPEFEEDPSLFRGWREKAEKSGLHFRTGRWNVQGKPIAIIVDFTPLFPKKDEILSNAWELWKLDSISGQWDYIEAALFGHAAGDVIKSFVDYYRHNNVIAHFHEWMTGMGVLNLGKNAPHITTAFTTHATVVGRSVAGNGMPLYNIIDTINGDEIAAKLGVKAKHSLEKLAANNAHCFSTVSEITSKECAQFLQKSPDLVTPNGFEPLLVPVKEELLSKQSEARKLLINLATAISGNSFSDEVLLVGTSGRYEFRNKGLDIFIDSLDQINKSDKLQKKVLAFIMVPANHYGPRKSILNRLNGIQDQVANSPYLSHNLHDEGDDPVIKALKSADLYNKVDDNVNVFFLPCYLNGNDGILNKPYYDIMMGLDLSIFPSYYEPWGYTPLESLAFGVPSITSDLAGFGLWIQENYPELQGKGIDVLNRSTNSDKDLIDSLSGVILKYCQFSSIDLSESRLNALRVSETARWKDFIKYYNDLYNLGLKKNESLESPKWDLTYSQEDEKVVKQQKMNDPIWRPLVVNSVLPKELNGLNDIAKNLWWTWNYRAENLFQRISPELWDEFEHNPIKLLMRVPFDRLNSLETDESFMYEYQQVYAEFNNYLNEKSGVDRSSVAYFSMEYGFHASLKIYSGGLGILAGDYLKEASDVNYPLTAVGLLYRHGYFKQVLTLNGEQLSLNIREEFSELPLIPVHDENNEQLKIRIGFPGRIIQAIVWKVLIGRVSLYLLDTDIEANQPQDRQLTSNLYGGDEETRLKQEMLLGVGGIRMISSLGLKPDIYHCNEGHAAFIGFERINRLMENKKFTFSESVEIVRSSTLFTTHTPVPAGHDAFQEDLLRTYMGHYPARLGIQWDEFVELGRMNKDDRNEKFSMSYLATHLSQEVNAVSKLHGEVTRDMFAPLWKGYFPDELHIGYVTNGVHYRTWTAEAWQELYSRTFGEGFLNEQSNEKVWHKIHDVSDHEIWSIKNDQRSKLFSYMKDRFQKNSIIRHEPPKQVLNVLSKIDPTALTIGFARRFATYKRAHLLFRDLERLAAIVNKSERPVQFLFAGKAHPRDKAGQDLIKFIIDISRKSEFAGRILFLENYDMTLARNLVQGVDIWLNTPTRPLEASGTSGMKAVMNGAMNFSVLDGWWCEGYREGAGWALSEERVYENQEFQDELDATTIYNLLEEEIVPLFYDRNEEGIPEGWIRHIKNTIADVAPKFTTKRMIDDYIDRFYSKLGARSSDVKAGNYHLARELSRWKKRIAANWDNIKLVSLDSTMDILKIIKFGSKYQAKAVIDTGGLSPDDIGIDLIVVSDKGMDNSEFIYSKEFTQTTCEGNLATYKLKSIPTQPGAFKLGVRMFPKNAKLPHRQDFNYIKWL